MSNRYKDVFLGTVSDVLVQAFVEKKIPEQPRLGFSQEKATELATDAGNEGRCGETAGTDQDRMAEFMSNSEKSHLRTYSE